LLIKSYILHKESGLENYFITRVNVIQAQSSISFYGQNMKQDPVLKIRKMQFTTVKYELKNELLIFLTFY